VEFNINGGFNPDYAVSAMSVFPGVLFVFLKGLVLKGFEPKFQLFFLV
jgi:hypothetical protein